MKTLIRISEDKVLQASVNGLKSIKKTSIEKAKFLSKQMQDHLDEFKKHSDETWGIIQSRLKELNLGTPDSEGELQLSLDDSHEYIQELSEDDIKTILVNDKIEKMRGMLGIDL